MSKSHLRVTKIVTTGKLKDAKQTRGLSTFLISGVSVFLELTKVRWMEPCFSVTNQIYEKKLEKARGDQIQ
jgi:hypothetical protein